MTERIRFICDSTADFPAELEKELGLHILPVHIVADGQDHIHGQTINNRQVIQALKQKRDIFTRPFYPHECADFFERCLVRYTRLVSFHLSTELSGNYNSAVAALNLMFEDEARRIKVMDLRGVSVSLGMVVKKRLNCCMKTTTWTPWTPAFSPISEIFSWRLQCKICSG